MQNLRCYTVTDAGYSFIYLFFKFVPNTWSFSSYGWAICYSFQKSNQRLGGKGIIYSYPLTHPIPFLLATHFTNRYLYLAWHNIVIL